MPKPNNRTLTIILPSGRGRRQDQYRQCSGRSISFWRHTTVRTTGISALRQSSGEQKGGILNHLLSSAGPGFLTQLAGAAPGLAALLGRGNRQLTHEEAQDVPSEAVHQIASRAEQEDPNVVESVRDRKSTRLNSSHIPLSRM